MKLFGKFFVLISLISSCEYNSKIILSKREPIVLSTSDKASIKKLSISYRKKGNTSYSNLLEIDLPEMTREVLLDSILAKKVPISPKGLYIPYEDYSVAIRTSKGIGGVQFYVDSSHNVIVIFNR
jgi:hypothetical protein